MYYLCKVVTRRLKSVGKTAKKAYPGGLVLTVMLEARIHQGNVFGRNRENEYRAQTIIIFSVLLWSALFFSLSLYKLETRML